MVSLTAFLVVISLGRWAGESALGVFALGWSCWFVSVSLADTLVATPYTYFLNRLQRGDRDLPMIALWGIVLLAACFVALLALLAALDVANLKSVWPALPIAVATSLVREFTRRHFLAVGKTRSLMILDVVGALLQVTLLGWLIQSGELTASTAFWSIALGASLPLLPMVSSARLRRFMAAKSSVAAGLSDFFGYGRWLLLGGICHALSVQSYPWLAFSAGGAPLTGLYAACTALVNVLTPVLVGLTNYFRPRFMTALSQHSRQHSQHADSSFARYVLQRAAFFVAPSILLCVALAVFGEFALGHIYGAAFKQGATALVWFGVGAVGVSLAAPVQLGLLALRKPVTNFYYHAVALAVIGLGTVTYSGALTLSNLAHINAVSNWTAALLLSALFIHHNRAAARLSANH